MIDLHMHSTASDGTDAPRTILTKCAKLNLELCSITDHDNIDSQAPAQEEAKARRIKYVTGVEFSASHTGELHILGYGIDIHNAAFSRMMEELRLSRIGRVHEIVRLLHEHEIDISFEDVERFAQGNTLGRPHVALALMDKGYASNFAEAFNKYLNENGLCYVKRRKLTAPQAIDLVRSAGGIPVLAHPKFIRTDDIGALVRDMANKGLGGIEAYYPAHSDHDVKRYLKLAEENGLIVTAGSDYHGKCGNTPRLPAKKERGNSCAIPLNF